MERGAIDVRSSLEVMCMSGTVISALFFLVFGVVMLWCGAITRKWASAGGSDYLIAGRGISLAVNAFGVGAIAFAGTTIAYVPGLTALFGAWGWIGWAITIWIGFVGYGYLAAPYARASGAYTLAEWLGMRFDSKTRTLILICTTVGLIGIFANNILGMALTITGYTGVSLVVTVSVIFALFLVITYLGGFWAVSLTDFLQMLLGLVVAPVIAFAFVSKFGGAEWLQSHLPSANLYTKGLAGSLPMWTLKFPSFLSFLFLFGFFLTWGSNYYWLRAVSSRNEGAAKHGFFWGCVIFTFVYVFLGFSGWYALAGAPAEVKKFGPMASYGISLKLVGPVVASLGLVAALAAAVSTATTAHMGIVTTLIRDFWVKFFRPNADAKDLLVPSKIMTLVVGVVVWGVCFYPGGPLYLFAISVAFLGPSAVAFLFGSRWRRTTSTATFASVLISMIVMLVIETLSQSKAWIPPWHSGIYGLFISIPLIVVISLITKPKYYGREDWTREQREAGTPTSTSALSDEERTVLDLIRRDYSIMLELVDFTGRDANYMNRMIEKLDQERLLKRRALSGAGFYHFELTQKGESVLKPLSAGEKLMVERHLSETKLKVLKGLEEGVPVRELPAKIELAGSEVGAAMAGLLRRKYVSVTGIFRPEYHITAEGRALLAQ
jgi:solute:Na+ symporter, SSS family